MNEPTLSRAGASARREYERRRARDEDRLRRKWGRLGGVAVALSDERASTTAWATGAVGEERLGARLEAATSSELAVIHDRRIPRRRTNIDHIAVTPRGIWVIDAKRYTGRPTLRSEGGIFRARVDKLVVGRRDCTRLVDGVLRQVEAVRAVVDEVPVIGVLCFVDADWPLLGGDFTIRGVQVLKPRQLTRMLSRPGPLDHDVIGLRDRLVESLPPA